MDGQKFDELIRSICTTRLTRWGALRGLVAGVAATVTGSALIADDADAKKGRGGARAEDKKKGRGAQDEVKGGKKGGGKKGRGKKGGAKKKRDAKKGASEKTATGGGGGGRLGAQDIVETCDSEPSLVVDCDDPSKPGCNGCKPDGCVPPDCNCNPKCGGVEFPAGPGGQTEPLSPCGCVVKWEIVNNVLSFGPADPANPCSVGTVIVKAGNESNIYTFDPAVTCANDLTGPNGAGGAGISHVEFCGIVCCVPKTCTQLGVCGEDLDAGCNVFIDCDCPRTCPEETTFGVNTECREGECVCTADTCLSENVACTAPGVDFDNGCCGRFSCPCPTNCPPNTDDGPNNTCTANGCVCEPDTCAAILAEEGVECGTGFDNGCCGTRDCNCPQNCPAGTDDGPNNTCDNGTCVCEPDTCVADGGTLTCGIHNDGCCGTVDCGRCPEGCTPGYWKQSQHFGSWTAPYDPTDLVSSVFTIPGCLPTNCKVNNKTLGQNSLLQALNFGGGGGACGAAQNLLRAAVAALLNAAALDTVVKYPRTPEDVIVDVNAALANCDRDAMLLLAGELDADNNLGCPLARATATSTAPAAVAAVEPGRKKIKKNRKARKGGRRKARN